MRRPTPSLVISVIALFVALGGTGYAAFKLPRNSVKSKNIVNGAIKGKDIKNGTITPSDLKAAPSEAPKTTITGWARVGSTGNVLDSQGMSFTGRGSTFAVYCFKNAGATKAVLATVDAGSDEGSVDPLPVQLSATTSPKRLGEVGCPAGSNLFVTVDLIDGKRVQPGAFYVAALG